MSRVKQTILSYFPQVEKLLGILHNKNYYPRLVGGCVRDALLKKEIKDIDIITPLLPGQVEKIFIQNNIKCIKDGAEFGTIKAILGKHTFDVTTLRKDIRCDGRYAEVKFTNSFKQDASRRDFTINALSYCMHNERIYDYFGGLKHLRENKVIFIGNPEERIREDYLRILRFFRFSLLYSKAINSKGYKACIKLKEGLNILSKERIFDELSKIIFYEHKGYILKKLSVGGFFEELTNLYFNIALFKRGIPISTKLDYPLGLVEKASLLLIENDEQNLKSELSRLKWPKAIINYIIAASRIYSSNGDIFTILSNTTQLNLENIKKIIYFLLVARKISFNQAKKILNSFKKSNGFPINGNDLLSLGHTGVDLKNHLHLLKLRWVKSYFSLTKEELMK